MTQIHRPTAADAYIIPFRRWVDTRGGHGPFGINMVSDDFLKAVGPRLTNDELMDRYHSHTKNCKACSAALKKCEDFQTFCRVLSPALLLAASLAAATAANLTAAKSAMLAFALPVVGAAVQLTLPQLWTAAGWLGAVGLAIWAASFWVEGFKVTRFIRGVYPPPRNQKH